MKNRFKIISFLVLVVGCKQPFPQVSETSLALPTLTISTPTSVVFIAGFDEGDNTYYSNAKRYYEAKGMGVMDNLFSVEKIIKWLNQNSNKEVVYDEILIVAHSNPWLGMSLKTVGNGGRITAKTLEAAKSNNEIPTLKNGINQETKIIFHSCGLGQNRELLQELKAIFAAKEAPKVYASCFFNVFGGKYLPHYLAKPYYNFYPTAESQGPAALAGEFKELYDITDMDW